jgi:hypothetical protein
MAKKAKVIYVARNPRDAVVSFLNHWTVMAGYKGSLDTLLDAFLAGVAGYYSPFLEVARSLTHTSCVYVLPPACAGLLASA